MKTRELKRAVITGLGVVAPNGIGLDAFWKSLEEGTSGIERIASFDPTRYRTQIAGEINDFDPSKYMKLRDIDRTDRFTQIAVAAARMALDDASLDIQLLSQIDAAGTYIGSGLGGMFFYEKQYKIFAKDAQPRLIHPNSIPRIMPSAVSGHIAIEFGLRGPNVTISTACSSSIHGIGLALDVIRLGRSKVMVTGGVDAPIIPLMFAGFDALRIMSTANDRPSMACRPFDRERNGFVMGEGAAILVLEELEHALKRGARIYAEMVGYGATSGAFHIVMPDPTGNDVKETMLKALEDAQMIANDIDYISAHGTATQLNDKAESLAIKSLFGVHTKKVLVSSVKSMIGHTLGAAGAMSVFAALLAIVRSIVPPTINYQNPDPECDLDVIPNVARKKTVNSAMVNAFGFGSNNGCLIMRKYR